MTDHPTADELLAAVSDFIERIAPQLRDRDVFLARVAVNALGVARREYLLGPAAEAAAGARLKSLLDRDGDLATLNAGLAAAIRKGDFDEREAELLAHLKACAVDQARIDQPGYSGLKAALDVAPQRI